MKSIRHYAASFRRHAEVLGLYGAVCRLLVAAGLRGPLFRARIPGTHKYVLIRLGGTDVSVFEQVILHKEYELGLPRSTAVIIDAGANIGLSAVALALQHPEARIYSVEADAGNHAMLCRNAALYPSITPIHAALWGEDAVLTVVDVGSGSWGLQVRDAGHSPGPDAQSVAAVSLESLCRSHAIDHVDLLKLDIEGAEYEVMARSGGWIGKVGTICAELHDRFKPGCTQVFDAATRDFGFRRTRGELVIVSRNAA